MIRRCRRLAISGAVTRWLQNNSQSPRPSWVADANTLFYFAVPDQLQLWLRDATMMLSIAFYLFIYLIIYQWQFHRWHSQAVTALTAIHIFSSEQGTDSGFWKCRASWTSYFGSLLGVKQLSTNWLELMKFMISRLFAEHLIQRSGRSDPS